MGMKSDMTHIDEGSLQAYLDAELRLEERWRAERHLEACDACRGQLAALRETAAEFSAEVSCLDAAPMARRHAVGWPRRRSGGQLRRMLPQAAVLLLFVGAAASATVPGSPVRRWILEIASPRPEAVGAPTAVPSSPVVGAPPSAAAEAEAGLSVEAEGGRVDVVLHEARDVRVRATMVEGSRAGVFGTGAAAASRFRGSTGRVEVVGAHGGVLRVEVPRRAARARVVVNGVEVLRLEAGKLEMEATAPSLDRAGVAFSVEH